MGNKIDVTKNKKITASEARKVRMPCSWIPASCSLMSVVGQEGTYGPQEEGRCVRRRVKAVVSDLDHDIDIDVPLTWTRVLELDLELRASEIIIVVLSGLTSRFVAFIMHMWAWFRFVFVSRPSHFYYCHTCFLSRCTTYDTVLVSLHLYNCMLPRMCVFGLIDVVWKRNGAK